MAIPLFGQGNQDQRYQQWLQTPAGQAFQANNQATQSSPSFLQRSMQGFDTPYQAGQTIAASAGQLFSPVRQLYEGAYNLTAGGLGGLQQVAAGLTGSEAPEKGFRYGQNTPSVATPVVPPANAMPDPLAGDLQSAAMGAAGMMADQLGAGTLADAQAAVAAAENDTAEQGNWFDALNSKVDLMAMGAAMLANSGSGMGTAANIGKGLQAGIASRAGADKIAKDREMAEALLLIRQQEALGKMAKAQQDQLGSRAQNFTANRDMLASALKAQGIDEGAEDAAAFIIQQLPFNPVNIDPTAINALAAIIAEEGTGWGLGSDEVKMKKLPSILAAWEKSLQSLQNAGK